MAGYFEDRESTEAVLKDGWLHTGDLGRIDAEGRLYLSGRQKDVIIDANSGVVRFVADRDGFDRTFQGNGFDILHPEVSPESQCLLAHLVHELRSSDAGASWEALQNGLPTGDFYPVVLRDAMCVDDSGVDSPGPAGVFFGTRSGEVFGSVDDGDSWSLVADHLPDVLTVRCFSA